MVVPAEEIWQLCHFDEYEISSHGRVRRVDSGRLLRTAGGGSRRGQYPRVSLWHNNVQKSEYVHRLVAHAFIGPCPVGHEVNHKDGNSFNPRVENLEYVTSTDNKLHAVRLRLVPAGEQHHGFKLKSEDVYAIKVLGAVGFSRGYLGKLFGCGKMTVSRILSGEDRKYDEVKTA